MVRAIMHGCNGKMGQVITGLVRDDEQIEIVAGVDAYLGIENTYPTFKTLAECDVEADVVIDFSNASAVNALLDECVARKLPVVLCTTGLSEEQLAKVDKASESTAVLRSANMSLGINLLMKLLKEAAKVLSPAGFDIELVEKHHNQKVDAPSGTAIALADSINEALDEKYTYNYDRSKERKKREKNEIGIVCVAERLWDSMMSSLRGRMRSLSSSIRLTPKLFLGRAQWKLQSSLQGSRQVIMI